MRNVAKLSVLVALAGCSSSAQPDVLVGTWGGDNILLTTTATHASLAFACSSVTFTSPISVDHDGHFAIVGVESLWALNGSPTTPFHLSGKMSGRNLMIGYYTGDPETPPPTSVHILSPGGFHPSIACERSR